MKILGIDLAGSDKRNTGIAFKYNGKIVTTIVKTDEEILSICENFNYIFIDAPLSLPEGKENIENRDGKHYRECDQMLRKMNIKFFPITLGPMRMLTSRGIKLYGKLLKKNKKVYEVFPGAFYDIMGISRKNKNEIIRFYEKLNIKIEKNKCSLDELDAIACFLTGFMFLNKKATLLKGKDGCIIIPKKVKVV